MTKTKKNFKPATSKPTFVGLLKRWFLAGLLVSAPILLTVYITWLLVNLIDSYATSMIPDNLNPQNYVSFPLPGFGIIFGGAVIIFIGFLTTNLFGNSMIKLGERLLGRLPVIRSVYGATKQIMETIMTSQSDAFREVVLIEYPRRGVWAIGFVTGKTKGEVQNMSSENLINVFVPTTPNPTSGFLLFFPREDAIALDMGVEEAVKMVVSGGIVTPDDPRANRKSASLSAPKSKAMKKKAPKQIAKKKSVKKKSA